jgi:hypothetical protein
MSALDPHRPSRVIEVNPDLAAELVRLLRADGHATLAEQVATLEIVDRCRCGDNFCATFYTAPPPSGAWGPGHETIALSPDKGAHLNVDVLDGKIVSIEALYRDELRRLLLALLP